MAPTIHAHTPSAEVVRHLSRSVTSLLGRRSDSIQIPPLASVFALVMGQTLSVTSRSATPLIARTPHPDMELDLELESMFHHLAAGMAKRQTVILAIPTTYQGLNSGPAPGVVVGITLGTIGGFLLLLYIILTAFRLTRGRVVKEEVITTHRSRRRSRSRSAMSEAPRRESRRETVVVEERVERERSRAPSPVVEEDDIVEVIEEHSPERRPSRKESKRTSGFRTVDPAEFGGGSRPVRKVSRR